MKFQFKNFVKYVAKRAHEAAIVEGAASVAFFALFSLFPLIIILVSILSVIYRDQLSDVQIMNMLVDVLPIHQLPVVTENLKKILKVRASFSVVSAVLLVFTSTNVFNALTRNVQKAWPQVLPRSFIKKRLVSFGLFISLNLLVPFFFMAKTLLAFLASIHWSFIPKITADIINWLSGVVIYIFIMLAYTLLYKIVPRHFVRWADALKGSVIITLLSAFTTYGFGKYFTSGLSRYTLIYGSLGAFVALMMWIFLLSFLALAGAHLTYGLRHYKDHVSK
ncbi:YihY/virulence factor BrkB family protein [bacterium]|nr:YihY/virulence factor BrkB family protein [bacterium]